MTLDIGFTDLDLDWEDFTVGLWDDLDDGPTVRFGATSVSVDIFDDILDTRTTMPTIAELATRLPAGFRPFDRADLVRSSYGCHPAGHKNRR